MQELNSQQIEEVHGGKKFFFIITGGLITGLIEGIICLPAGGPAGFLIGFGHGFIEGAGGVIIYENANGLVETMHPNM